MVELASATEGQALVGGVADESVCEAALFGPLGHHQSPQPLPDLRRHLLPEDLTEEAPIEPHAQHGGGPQDLAVGRPQPVDLGRQQQLEVVREGVERQVAGHRIGQLEQEKRVAARPLEQRLAVVGR